MGPTGIDASGVGVTGGTKLHAQHVIAIGELCVSPSQDVSPLTGPLRACIFSCDGPNLGVSFGDVEVHHGQARL